MMAQHARVEESVLTTFNPEELKPKAETIRRTIVFFISWFNAAFAFFGMPQLDIPEDTVASVLEGIYVIGSAIFTFVASSWGSWKNNSYTKAAIVGDMAMDEIKETQDFMGGI